MPRQPLAVSLLRERSVSFVGFSRAPMAPTDRMLPARRSALFWIAGLFAILAVGGWLWMRRDREGTPGDPASELASEKVAARFAGSASCRPCHEEAFAAWEHSHHAAAELPISRERHADAFRPERLVSHGTQETKIRERAGHFEIVSRGSDGKPTPFRPARVIGVAPLWQPVVAAPGGRYQVLDVAFDPAEEEWFNVFGDEDRRPDEWGYWANRGMTWNSMCASCHTTDFQKRYDDGNDAYDSRFVELGVGCESCHGPRAEHVESMLQRGPAAPADTSSSRLVSWPPRSFGAGSPGQPLVQPIGSPAAGTLDFYFQACGGCHARRVELTGRFRAGAHFLDHYRPVIPDQTEIYYPDGQVHEEDFEFVSFLSSRMYEQGVRCVHCHEPHSGELRASGNDLCLGCHGGSIDPAKHSGHDPTGEGGQCINCHMPQTVYMQRHRRHDHGFTIPDALLTREHGIPNACNRCHTDRSTEWAIEASERLFGTRLDRWTRTRTRAVARGRTGEADAAPALLDVLAEDPSALWRSVAIELLGDYAFADARVEEALVERLSDEEPIVRATAVRRLDPLGPERLSDHALAKVRALLADPYRVVRNEAAWLLRRGLPNDAPQLAELRHQLQINSDQPTGALQRATFLIDRRALEPLALPRAIDWLERSVEWDPNTAFLQRSLATAYSLDGRSRDAIRALRQATQIEPESSAWHFDLALAHGEIEEYAEAAAALEEALDLDANFARAWYNLALVRDQMRDERAALEAIDAAIRIEPRNADYHFTRATLCESYGQLAAALESVEQALAEVRAEAVRVAASSRRSLELTESGRRLGAYRARLLEALGE